MGPRFDDLIAYDGDNLIAIGPLRAGDNIEEICAWVFQPNDERTEDSAATEMTTDTGGAELFRQAAGERWLLPLKKITAEPFHPGRAFAVAVALMTEDGAPTVEREMGQKKGRVVWWGQPVAIFPDAQRVATALALPAGVLADPLFMTPATDQDAEADARPAAT
jgi:hypothetical protein